MRKLSAPSAGIPAGRRPKRSRQRVVSQLSLFSGGLESIQDTLKEELSADRTTTIDTSALSADLENLRQTLAENIANAPVAGEGAPAPVSSNQMEAISGAIEKYLSNPVRRPQRRKGISRCWPNANRP